MFKIFQYKSNLLNKVITRFRNVYILKRLLISFLIVILVPTIIIATSNYRTYSKEMESTITYYLELLTENIYEILLTDMEHYEKLSYKVYKDEYISSLLNENEKISLNKNATLEDKSKYEKNKTIINNMLFALTSENEYVSNVQIITPYDQYTQISQDGRKKGAIISNLNVFRNLPEYNEAINNNGYPLWFDQPQKQTLFLNQSNNSQIIFNHISMSRSLIDFHTGKTLGVIHMNIDLRFLINIKGIKFDNKGNILFMSKDGALMSLNENVKTPAISQESEIAEKIYSTSSGSLTEYINDKPYLIYFKQLPNSPYYLIYIIDKLSIFSSSKTIFKLNFNVLLICTFLALIIAYIVTLSIIIPLNKLKKNMDKAARKNLNVFYDDNSNDEISNLGNNFNNMIGDIESLIDNLYKAEINEKTLNFRKKNAELNALQMQINPHFLYNTLDLIRWESMYEVNGESKVSNMIEDFSKLLRLSVKKGNDLVPVSEEINHIQAYLKVINYKYTNKILLKTNFNFDISLYKISKLTFQPLVENSIVHGFVNNILNKTIEISGSIVNDKILITIKDNGIGMEEDKLNEVKNNLNSKTIITNKIGICNVNERIKLYSSDNFGLSVYSKYGEGTITTITFPTTIDINSVSKEDLYV
ncbi:sensor histidine kinase [Clostridium sp.]|uniref:cache domain-containing sensor histidine kinase n=1 Tax=Clostridium sp. TaxID=1506 RepID=UPI00261B78B3|nr:sensor histidine kinase [Clostridium sp.]